MKKYLYIVALFFVSGCYINEHGVPPYASLFNKKLIGIYTITEVKRNIGWTEYVDSVSGEVTILFKDTEMGHYNIYFYYNISKARVKYNNKLFSNFKLTENLNYKYDFDNNGLKCFKFEIDKTFCDFIYIENVFSYDYYEIVLEENSGLTVTIPTNRNFTDYVTIKLLPKK